MSAKLILLAFLIGATFSLNSCNDGYKWWEANDSNGYLKSLQYIESIIQSIVEDADDICVGGDSKKWSAAYDKSVDTVVKTCAVNGKLINNVFPGLGTIFSNLCTAHITINVCLFKSDKLRQWNGGQTDPDLCTKAGYGSEWGCRSGNYSSTAEIIEAYGLVDATQQVYDLLNKYTGNKWDEKGLEALNKNIRIPVGSIVNFAAVIDIYPCLKRQNPKYFDEALKQLYIVVGGVENNIKPGYGLEFIKGFKKFYDVIFLEAGFPDISKNQAEVTKLILNTGPFDWSENSNYYCEN